MLAQHVKFWSVRFVCVNNTGVKLEPVINHQIYTTFIYTFTFLVFFGYRHRDVSNLVYKISTSLGNIGIQFPVGAAAIRLNWKAELLGSSVSVDPEAISQPEKWLTT